MKKGLLLTTILLYLIPFSACSNSINNSISEYEGDILEGMTEEQIVEMNQVFKESGLLPNDATKVLEPQKENYFGVVKEYAILHYEYMRSQIIQGSGQCYEHNFKEWTMCLAYSLNEKKFYFVKDLYEKNIFSDEDMCLAAPHGYLKKTHIQGERITYEVYVDQLVEYKEGLLDIEGEYHGWINPARFVMPPRADDLGENITGVFIPLSYFNNISMGVEDNFNNKRTHNIHKKHLYTMAQSYLIQKKLEAKTSVFIEYYGDGAIGYWVSAWANNEETSQEIYEETINGATFINEEGHPLYYWRYITGYDV